MVSPQELEKRTFATAMRGYEITQVDEYVDFLLEKYKQLYEANVEAEGEIRRLTLKFESIRGDEDAIHNAIIKTQKLCDIALSDANRDAERIRGEAQAEADRLVSDAEQEAARSLGDLQGVGTKIIDESVARGIEMIDDAQSRSDMAVESVRSRCESVLAQFRTKLHEQRRAYDTARVQIEKFKNELFAAYMQHINTLEQSMPRPDANFEVDESRITDEILDGVRRDLASLYAEDNGKSVDAETLKSAIRREGEQALGAYDFNRAEDVAPAPQPAPERIYAGPKAAPVQPQPQRSTASAAQYAAAGAKTAAAATPDQNGEDSRPYASGRAQSQILPDPEAEEYDEDEEQDDLFDDIPVDHRDLDLTAQPGSQSRGPKYDYADEDEDEDEDEDDGGEDGEDQENGGLNALYDDSDDEKPKKQGFFGRLFSHKPKDEGPGDADQYDDDDGYEDEDSEDYEEPQPKPSKAKSKDGRVGKDDIFDIFDE